MGQNQMQNKQGADKQGQLAQMQRQQLEKSQQLVLKFGPRIEGVFAVNESSADGMFTALQEHGLLDQVQLIGFDPNERMVQALGEGKIKGIVLQDPVKMGYLAVMKMYDHLEGKSVDARVPTGEFVATPDKMADESMQKLLKPEQYAGADFEPAEAKYNIAVIPKGTTHEFWQSVHAGVHKAALFPCLFLRLGQCRQQQRGQNRDNCDNYQ